MEIITIDKDDILQKGKNEISKTMRRRPLVRYQEKKNLAIIDALKVQIANAPQFLEKISSKGEIALDISQDVAKKIASGELEFSRKSKSGEAVGILRNVKTGEFFTQVPLKDLPIELGASIASAGLNAQLQEIAIKLEILGEKINQVNRNFDLDRYAEVQSAREKFEMAILIKDPETKKALLQNSLSQATDAKNLLLNQLYETKSKFNIPESKNFLPLFNKELRADDAALFANIALENLSYMKDAFSFQIATLTELREFEALSYTVSEFKQIVLDDFAEENALFLDGKLEVDSNPFKYLAENVIDASDKITEFIVDNEDLLEIHFLPKSLYISDLVEEKYNED